MTRKEAIAAMREGKKVTHKYFTREEWATQKDGMILLEDGVKCTPMEFWIDRTSDLFANDWEIWKPIE